MNNLVKKKLLENVDREISLKLENLRPTIWNHLKDVPLEELEQTVKDLRLSGICTMDIDAYVELHSELGIIMNRINNRNTLKVNPQFVRDIVNRLCQN